MAQPDRPTTSFDHAANTLRELDPDRYAATLILPPRHRPAAQALHAFAAEVAAVRERVTEPTPGEIRLQWWVDALEGKEHGAVRSNPVADALLATLEGRELPAGPLLRLLAARRFDLYGDPMPDMGQFEGYAGETVSVLYQYNAMILAEGTAESAAEAAGHAGVAEALVGHLRAFGFNASRQQLFLPQAVFAAHGVRDTEIFAGESSDNLRAALAQLAEMARDHLERAQAALGHLPKTLRPAFAQLALVRSDLKALERTRANPFAQPPASSRFRRLATLTAWGLRNG